MIIPGAESFFFGGNRIGCLLVHGFTGTPKEMRWMGEYLSAKGYTVLGVRLAGHATRPEDLIRTRWQDWIASVEDGYHLLKCATDSIFLMGLSLGGTLSLLFSTQEQVTGVVAMSTLITLPSDPRLAFAEYLAWIKPSVEKGPPDWHNLEAANDHIDYPFYPTRAIAEMRDLVIETRAALPKVRIPILLAHSRIDESVTPDNMEYIYNNINSTDKEMFWVENSGHVIVREPERKGLFQEVDNFIRRVVGLV
jgi:carboxylesterase